MRRPRFSPRALSRGALLSAIGACLLAVALPTYAQFGSRAASGLEQADTRRVLPAEQAFPLEITALANGGVRLTWTPAQDHYLYRHRFAFSLASPAQPASAEPAPLTFTLPDGKAMEDEFFGAIEAYFGSIAVDITLPQAAPDGSELVAHYQGCASWGFCYPPQTLRIALEMIGR